MAFSLTNPQGLPKVDFHRQVSIATGSRLVFMAGQVAWDADGTLVGVGDLAAQGGLDSGKFYASAQNTISGPLFDQADIVADFSNETIQDHAYAAIHAFLPSQGESRP